MTKQTIINDLSKDGCNSKKWVRLSLESATKDELLELDRSIKERLVMLNGGKN